MAAARPYDFLFEDGSLCSVPETWREVYDRALSHVDPAAFEARLRFVVGKYLEHRATPSTFDGLWCPLDDDDRFDDQRFYANPWDHPMEGKAVHGPPTMAAIARDVLYSSLRLGLMQQAADRLAAEKGTTPIRVLDVEEFLRELQDRKQQDP